MPLTLSKRAQVVPQVKISPPENLVLDNFAIRPAATFNLRRTTRHYDGAMVTVRGTSSIVPLREFKSDVRGDLDIRALLAFIGNGSGFVDRWNNPNDSSRDAVQTTEANQPQIVNAGVLNIVNSRSSLSFDGTNHFMLVSSTFTTASAFAVLNALDAGGVFKDFNGIFGGTTGVAGFVNWVANVGVTTIRPMEQSAVAGTSRVNGGVTTQFAPLSTLKVLSSINTTVLSTTNWHLGQDRANTPRRWQGNISELVAFSSGLSTADRQLLERDQAKYFSILGVP